MSRLQRGLNSTGGGASNGGVSRSGSLGGNNSERNAKSLEELKRIIHGKLVDKLDLSRVSDLAGDTLRREIRLVVERLCDTENPLLNRMERERLIDEVLDETFGFGPLSCFERSDDQRYLGQRPAQDLRNVAASWKTDVKFRDNVIYSDHRSHRVQGRPPR